MGLEHAKGFYDLTNAFVCASLNELLQYIDVVFEDREEEDFGLERALFTEQLVFSIVFLPPDVEPEAENDCKDVFLLHVNGFWVFFINELIHVCAKLVISVQSPSTKTSSWRCLLAPALTISQKSRRLTTISPHMSGVVALFQQNFTMFWHPTLQQTDKNTKSVVCFLAKDLVNEIFALTGMERNKLAPSIDVCVFRSVALNMIQVPTLRF